MGNLIRQHINLSIREIKVLLFCLTGNCHQINGGVKLCPYRHSSIRYLKFHQTTHFCFQQFTENIPSRFIYTQGFSKMPLNNALPEQFGHSIFQQVISLPVNDAADLPEMMDHVLRSNQVAHPESGRNGFAERAAVHDHPETIRRGERQQWLTEIMKIIIIIIFENDESMFFGQLQEPDAAFSP